ncbi:MAG: hypothetical protein EOP28_00375 [Rhodococcus sp. (in: high G+C Gram-positive bacteria)]|nr:MAG: hypothetical protein EOP28_00375 [Rhodococcus sp. (in: high G+C Gram-positive bacteria)]
MTNADNADWHIAEEIVSTIEQGEKLWPWNSHLLEDQQIEDYVRLILRDREEATLDEVALITPNPLGQHSIRRSGTLPEVSSIAVTDIDQAIEKMGEIDAWGKRNGTDGFACVKCYQRIPGGMTDARRFEIIWISVPPSIIGIALCPKCLALILSRFGNIVRM